MISVVIPSYNRRDFLLRLIKDLHLQQGSEYEVIVVDDYSSDGSVEAIRAAYPQVKLIVNNENSGCSITRNRGIRAAQGQIIVGLDSDVTLPDRDLLMKISQTFDNSPGTNCLAFRILEADGRTDDIPRWWHPAPIATYSDKPFETDYFSGTAFAFRKDSLIAAGLFPEHLFQYYEEVELSYRIIENSGIIKYCPHLAVLHHPGVRNGWSEHRFYHNPRSQILLASSCYPLLKAVAFLLTRLGRSMLRAVTQHRMKAYTSGISAGFLMIAKGKVTRKPLKATTWQRIKTIRQHAW